MTVSCKEKGERFETQGEGHKNTKKEVSITPPLEARTQPWNRLLPEVSRGEPPNLPTP